MPIDYRFVVQSLLLMTVRVFGWLFGEAIDIKSVHFSFAKNANDERLVYLFGDGIEFGCLTNAIRIDKRYAAAELSCTRSQVRDMLKTKRELFLLTRHKHPLSQEIRRMLLAAKDAGRLEIEDVAGRLGMTPNRLWRSLKKKGRTSRASATRSRGTGR